MALEPGTAVAPNIKLVRPLRTGGMGSVWIADHAGLGTEVAVKFMSVELGDHPQARGRFTREAQAAARIRDPHIVQIFDHGVMSDGTPFLVMELLEGQSLEERLASQERLSLAETVVVIAQAAGVLDKAHQMGIVHRDIKPGNLFLTSAGNTLFVKILDFGIAKQHGNKGPNALTTSSGAVLGTPGYMSPEQLLEAKGADPSADRWALAVVAYEMITGALPFEGETFAAVNLAICTAKVRPASSVLPDLPAAVDGFFAQAFHIDRKQRFATAAELARAFREACGETAIVAPPPARITVSSQESLVSGDTALATSVVGPQSVMSTTTTVREERGSKRRWMIVALATVTAAIAASAIWSGRREPIPSAVSSNVEVVPQPVVTSSEPSAPAPPSASASVPAPRAAPPVKRRAPPPVQAPKADCRDPFYIDQKGIKRVRRECL